MSLAFGNKKIIKISLMLRVIVCCIVGFFIVVALIGEFDQHYGH
jgi:hypothetical protein